MYEKIEEVLERDVRPELAYHGGDVSVVSYEDGVLKVRLLGQCSGCPSAGLTTESLIAEKIKATVPEVRDVVLLSGVGEKTMDMARAILRQRHENRA